MKKLLFLFAILTISSVAQAASPIRYVQISTNTLTRQTGTAVVNGINSSSTTINNVTIGVPTNFLKYVQIVSSSSQANTTTTSSAFTSTTLSKSITPTSSGNRIMVQASGLLIANNANGTGFPRNGVATLFRDSTNLSTASNAFFCQAVNVSSQSAYTACTMQFIDRPNTTSPITYSVRIANTDNVTNTGWGNQSDSFLYAVEISTSN